VYVYVCVDHVAQGVFERESMSERVCVGMYVCVSIMLLKVCVCVRERVRESLCVYVCLCVDNVAQGVSERDRE